MNVVCDRVTSERRLEPASPNGLSASWREGDVARWVDVEAPTPEGLRRLLATLDLHPLIVERCLEPGQGSRVGTYEKSLLVEFPVGSLANGGESTEVSILCFPTMLVTIHGNAMPRLAAFAAELTRDARLCTARVPGLLYELFDRLIDFEAQEYLTVRKRASELEDLIDEDPSGAEVGDIVALRQSVRRLADLIEDQSYCVQNLQATKSQAFELDDEREYFAVLAGSFTGGSRLLTRLEERMRDVYERHQVNLQETTSSRLRILTVLSAVYLPATLVAAIYGMNFDNIPAIQWDYGYGAVMAIMLVIVVGQLLFFSWRGWFN